MLAYGFVALIAPLLTCAQVERTFKYEIASGSFNASDSTAETPTDGYIKALFARGKVDVWSLLAVPDT